MLLMRVSLIVPTALLLMGSSCQKQDAPQSSQISDSTAPRPAARAERKLNAHYDDPIVIDNPQAFVAILPDDHDDYLLPPEDEDRSVAIMWGHNPYTKIKLKGTEGDGTYDLDAKQKVEIAFDNVKGITPRPAGKMTIEWWTLGQDKNLVTMTSQDDPNSSDEMSRLRWKRFRRLDDNLGDRLGLIRRHPKLHDYRIASVTYHPAGSSTSKTAKKNTAKVEIRLCTATATGAKSCN